MGKIGTAMPPRSGAESPALGSGLPRAALVLVTLAIGASGLSIGGCNRGPARSALEEADQALAAARPALERYLPAELERLEADRAEARARLAQGRYTDALRIAQRLPGRIAVAASLAESRRGELGPAWAGLGGSVRLGIDTLGTRLAEIEGGVRSARGFGGAPALASAKAELAAARQLWQQAEDESERDLARAVRLAREAQDKLEALAARLAPAAPAAAGVVRAPAAVAPPGATPPPAPTTEAPPATSPPPPPTTAAPPPTTPPPTTNPPAPPPTTLAEEPPPPLEMR